MRVITLTLDEEEASALCSLLSDGIEEREYMAVHEKDYSGEDLATIARMLEVGRDLLGRISSR